MSRAEAAIRRAGALMALAAAASFIGLPAGAEHAVLLALHALFLLGCAAVQLASAHRAVAALARRAAEATRGKVLGASAAGLRRWAGFVGILLYTLYEYTEVRAEASAPDKVKAFLLLLAFLGAVWAMYLSMVTGRVAPAQRPSAAAEEEDVDGGELDAMETGAAAVLVDSKVWNIRDCLRQQCSRSTEHIPVILPPQL